MFKTFKTFYHFILNGTSSFSLKKRLIFVGFIVIVVVAAVLGSILPYFYKLFIDALTNSQLERLIHLILLYVGISFTALLADMLSYFVGDIILFRASIDARSSVFKHVLDLDFFFHSNKSTGSLISAFKRGDGAFFDMFHIIHHRIAGVIVGFIVMLYFFSQFNWMISISSITSILLALVAMRFLVGYNIKKRQEFNKEEDNIAGIIADNMINYETVKLFAREKFEQNRLAQAFKTWLSTLWGFGNSFRLIDISIGSLINLSIFATLMFAVVNTNRQIISIGDFVLVATFTSAFFPRLWDLVWGSRDMAKAYSDIQTYFALLDNVIEVKDPEHPVKVDHIYGEINFNKVHFTYNGRSKNAINGINLKIDQGQSVALVGRSGSGKTTLTKLLMRFYDIESGEITIDGINVKDFTKSTLRSFVGVVPQEPILFNNTIAYNIGYGKDKFTPSEVKRASKLANIDEFIEGLKEKYDTEVGERGVKLSGGQKQRLAIARMILSDPDIVVFDEATSHLDSESEKLIQDAFWKARAGKTTIIIAHRLSTVMRADKIVVMEHGKIKEVGTHESLLKDKDSLYSHFWNLQIKLD
jgi:ATP-binding cassette, subfamily B, heavy metal transporter